MELDFRTIKALSSPTRITILDRLLDKEATPTTLSDDLDKSKSTISSHLSVLVDADLVEKDAEDGRRRVVYSPTSKAAAIVKGQQRRITFSLSSAIVSSLLLLGTGWTLLNRLTAETQAQETAIETFSAESGDAGGIGSMDAAGSGGEAIIGSLPTEALAFIGAVLVFVLIVSAGTFFVSRALDDE